MYGVEICGRIWNKRKRDGCEKWEAKAETRIQNAKKHEPKTRKQNFKAKKKIRFWSKCTSLGVFRTAKLGRNRISHSNHSIRRFWRFTFLTSFREIEGLKKTFFPPIGFKKLLVNRKFGFWPRIRVLHVETNRKTPLVVLFGPNEGLVSRVLSH